MTPFLNFMTRAFADPHIELVVYWLLFGLMRLTPA